MRLTLLSFGLTAGLLGFCMVALGVIVGVPAVVDALHLPKWMAALLHLLPWPVLGAAAVGGLALLYTASVRRKRRPAEGRGCASARCRDRAVAGRLGGVLVLRRELRQLQRDLRLGRALVGLLMWFYLSAYVVIVGAELNSEIEHQTKRDTTVGHDRPMGERRGVRRGHRRRVRLTPRAGADVRAASDRLRGA